jgi:hypothetical protein
MIELIIALGLGITIGFSLAKSKPEEKEQPPDYAYYKNLSESLMQDVRRLREELRKKDDNLH